MDGKKVVYKTPQEAEKAGIVYISHRMEEIFELCDRITVLRDGEYVGTRNICDIYIEGKKCVIKSPAQAIEEFRIKCFSEQQECNNLSGGNQQKVLLAKWMFADPDVLILDEPTRGIDVGAAEMIRKTIVKKSREEGTATLLCSPCLKAVCPSSPF